MCVCTCVCVCNGNGRLRSQHNMTRALAFMQVWICQDGSQWSLNYQTVYDLSMCTEALRTAVEHHLTYITPVSTAITHDYSDILLITNLCRNVVIVANFKFL